MALERTLIILKPDAVQRNLCGEIISRFEKKGLQIVGMKLMKISPQLAETHYEAHKARPFYPGLVKFMTSSPVIVMALAGKDAIAIARNMMGATFGSKAAPGTIRGELGVFFKADELVQWTPMIQPWVYDMSKGQPE